MDPFFSQRYQQQVQQEQQQQQQQQQQQYQQQNPTTPRPLQGPRPAPLKVSKDSHKISKPPPGRLPAGAGHRPPLPPAQRQPVIIYAVSPKVIHTQPSQFMSVVQRLTGFNSSSPSTSANPISPAGFPSPSGVMSPAAKLATIERAQQTTEHTGKSWQLVEDFDIIERYDAGGGSTVAQSNYLGILSPNPSSLPEISPNFFSSGMPELNSLGFLDMIGSLSPSVPVNKNFADNSFLHSPTFPFTPTVPSPSWDLFAPSFYDF